MSRRVVVAMSGGVDSSVAALLLKQRGFEVVGITMCLGIKDNGSDKPRCCGVTAIDDARRVCHRLGIPHYVMDFSRDLEEKVIGPFAEEYLKGRTPNPCIECNRHIKFWALLIKALSLGFGFIATGHYAAIGGRNGRHFLKRAKDRKKDQTYFLYPIKYDYLKSILFPLSRLTKEEVRHIARDAGLPVADKPQSQDICFITGENYGQFIKQRIGEVRSGLIVDLDGKTLGQHKGVCFYTIGQREGLGISSKRPLYVIAIDSGKNQIIVGEREGLRAKGLLAKNINILAEELPKEMFAKIRHTHKEAKCRVSNEGNRLKVVFDEAQEAITPGQSVVFYHEDVVVAGGIIDEVLYGYN